MNDKIQSSNVKKVENSQIQNPSGKRYDLAERTAKFGEEVIIFAPLLPRNSVNQVLVSQLVRSATSVGANYIEADGAESKKDFRHKIGISKKEAKETKYWLRMVAKSNPTLKGKCDGLLREAHELSLILSSIFNKV